MTRTLAALPLCLLCCTSADPTPCAEPAVCGDLPIEYVCIDTALPQDPVRAGIRQWRDALCDRRRLQMYLVDGAAPLPELCRYTLLYAQSDWPWVQTSAAGFAEVDRGIAWIVVDRVPPSLLRAVAAHEMGHLLGIAADGSGIMADPLVDTCITPENVAAVK